MNQDKTQKSEAKISPSPFLLFSPSLPSPILVIGYGNTLRSDDGIGQWVAEKVASWKLPEVRSLSVFQLTPELAAEMVNYQTVIFVDATAQNLTDLEILPLTPEKNNLELGHYLEPRSLLFLTQFLYHSLPLACWILIPGVNFDFGEEFSPLTQTLAEKTLTIIKDLTKNART